MTPVSCLTPLRDLEVGPARGRLRNPRLFEWTLHEGADAPRRNAGSARADSSPRPPPDRNHSGEDGGRPVHSEAGEGGQSPAVRGAIPASGKRGRQGASHPGPLIVWRQAGVKVSARWQGVRTAAAGQPVSETGVSSGQCALCAGRKRQTPGFSVAGRTGLPARRG
jgi:hypothetical protein